MQHEWIADNVIGEAPDDGPNHPTGPNYEDVPWGEVAEWEADPIPNESTVIARVIVATAEDTVGEEPPPMTDMQRQDLLDEIEFDLL